MALMSQRAYARHRAERGFPGTTHRAVQKAIEAGRIKVNGDGLIDSAAADRAWEANSSESHRRPGTGSPKAKAVAPPREEEQPAPKAQRARASPPPPPIPARRPPPPPSPPPASPPSEPPQEARPGMSLADASALEKVWKARLAELEFEERSGRLVAAAEVEARWVELVTLSKTKLLALPGKAKARIPKLTAADVGVLDQLIREALKELAQSADVEEDATDGR